VRANRILPPAEEAVAQSSCLGRLIRTHVTLLSGARPGASMHAYLLAAHANTYVDTLPHHV